jgi:hypothetical protein
MAFEAPYLNLPVEDGAPKKRMRGVVDGRVCVTRPFRAEGPPGAMEAWAEGGGSRVTELVVHELKSIWR